MLDIWCIFFPCNMFLYSSQPSKGIKPLLASSVGVKLRSHCVEVVGTVASQQESFKFASWPFCVPFVCSFSGHVWILLLSFLSLYVRFKVRLWHYSFEILYMKNKRWCFKSFSFQNPSRKSVWRPLKLCFLMHTRLKQQTTVMHSQKQFHVNTALDHFIVLKTFFFLLVTACISRTFFRFNLEECCEYFESKRSYSSIWSFEGNLGRCLKKQLTPVQILSHCSNKMFSSFRPSSGFIFPCCANPSPALTHIRTLNPKDERRRVALLHALQQVAQTNWQQQNTPEKAFFLLEIWVLHLHLTSFL